MNKTKCVEYYFDSNKYSQEDIVENLNKEMKNFPGKKAIMDIELNQWGVYVAKLAFYNKNKIFKFTQNKIKPVKKKNKMSKIEKYSNKTYGEYKHTTTYKPCSY